MKVFFTYSDDIDDINLYNDLTVHMKMSVLKNILSYTDKKSAFAAGIDLNNSQKLAMDNDIIITLLSADFLNENKSLELLKESKLQNKIVLPLLGRDCLYSEIEELKPYLENLIPKERSILGLSKNAPDPHEIFTDIVEKIQTFILGDIRANLYSGKHFLWISIVSIVIGFLSSAYLYIITLDLVLMVLILGLFIIISTLSMKKYLILNKSL